MNVKWLAVMKNPIETNHEYYMKMALAEAKKAADAGEVPIGAILLGCDQKVLARAANSTIFLNDPSGHAEILAIRKAAEKECNYRLLNTTLYVTIEPCVMCMGAILHARIQTLVFGAPDPKWGGAGSLYALNEDSRLNHRVEVIRGVCMDESRELIQRFFRERREKKKTGKILAVESDVKDDA